jgi:tRNA isopentenyl-2-thiomethyl-A-37 hydroxylase MiaE
LPEILADYRLGRIVQPVNPNNFANSLMEMAKLIEQQSISPKIISSAYLERYAPEKVGAHYSELLAYFCK